MSSTASWDPRGLVRLAGMGTALALFVVGLRRLAAVAAGDGGATETDREDLIGLIMLWFWMAVPGLGALASTILLGESIRGTSPWGLLRAVPAFVIAYHLAGVIALLAWVFG